MSDKKSLLSLNGSLNGRRLLLIITGSVAAFKALEVIRLLRAEGAEVETVLTEAAKAFVTPLSAEALSGSPVFTELFAPGAESKIGHIELSRQHDLILILPASADFLAKCAAGLADDLASTLILATDKKVIAVPAMNVRMWENPATKRNIAWLKAHGMHFIGPTEGVMACGEYGFGRMADPDFILEAVAGFFRQDLPLKGRRALVTAGPTHEAIDPVRYVANRSSGRQGFALAEALRDLGATVELISGPVALASPLRVKVTKVETGREMLAAVEAALPADIAVFAAAVADWYPENPVKNKLKKENGESPALIFRENPDILATIAQRSENRPALVIGFAAETEDLAAKARAKYQRKGCDWLVANFVGQGSEVMGGTHNEITLITREGTEKWPRLSKEETAGRLARKIAGVFYERD